MASSSASLRRSLRSCSASFFSCCRCSSTSARAFFSAAISWTLSLCSFGAPLYMSSSSLSSLWASWDFLSCALRSRMMSRSLLPFSLSGMGSSSLASSSLRCEEAEGVPPSSRPPWPGCGQLTGAPSSPRLDPLSLDVDDADEGTVVELTATLDISSVCFSLAASAAASLSLRL
uniref:Putative secreted protein n=1 Tax=Ixodes ricinus TaxID=34613 RepID=A0A6B0UZI8_IXORI